MNKKKYKIERNSLCPCCSGKKYKHCCLLYINTSMKDRYNEFIKENNYKKAIISLQVYLTQYKIWHEEHTVPFFNTDLNQAESLLIIDIQAIISTLNTLSNCLEKLNYQDQVDEMLQRAEFFINDNRYNFCLNSLRAFRFALMGDLLSAKNLLENSPKFIAEELADFEHGLRALRIYIDFLWQDLPLEKSLTIARLLINNEQDTINQIQNFLIKALILFTYNDKISALNSLDEAINISNEINCKTDSEKISIATSIARAHELIGLITNDVAECNKAIECYKDVLSIINNNEAKAKVYQSMAHVYDYLSEFESAEMYFEKSKNLFLNVNISLDLSRIKLMLGKLDETINILKEINKENLNDNYLIDYYAIMANVAIQNKDNKLCLEIDRNLNALNIKLPLLDRIRNNIRIFLSKNMKNKPTKKSILSSVRKGINKVFLLQPNFFGLGININELIKPKENENK